MGSRYLAMLAIALTVVLGTLAGCASASGAATGAELVAQRCTRCHPVDRINAATHDRAAWTATVDRMRGKGAQLTDAEAASVVDYLSTR